jgi:5-methylcytosine-specific restriction endonuclease McrA
MGRNRAPESGDARVQLLRERARRYYYAHRESRLATAKARQSAYRADPERRALLNERAKEYGRANMARMIEKAEAWRKANPKRALASKRRQYARNPQKWRFWKANYLAALRGAAGKHTAAEVRARLEEQCHLCAYCLAPMTDGHEVEHVIPVARGGSNDIDNIVCACPTCNNSKNDRTILEYLQYRERRAA